MPTIRPIVSATSVPATLAWPSSRPTAKLPMIANMAT